MSAMCHRFRLSLAIVLALLLVACVTSGGPADNADFAVIKKLSELDGVYRDTSEEIVISGGQRQVESLTHILWPGLQKEAGLAEKVEVRALGQDRIMFRAIDLEGKVLKEQTYVVGQDIEFADGRIRMSLDSRWEESHRAVLGPSDTEFEFGIDRQRHAKAIIKTTAADALFFPLPFIWGYGPINAEILEMRFVRIGD